MNDFNLYGRTYRVTAQAAAPFRLRPDDIRKLETRNAAGEMLPLASVATIEESTGPATVTRYNLYPAADLSGQAASGVSTGQALERLAVAR